jgi:hypothetical protein
MKKIFTILVFLSIIIKINAQTKVRVDHENWKDGLWISFPHTIDSLLLEIWNDVKEVKNIKGKLDKSIIKPFIKYDEHFDSCEKKIYIISLDFFRTEGYEIDSIGNVKYTREYLVSKCYRYTVLGKDTMPVFFMLDEKYFKTNNTTDLRTIDHAFIQPVFYVYYYYDSKGEITIGKVWLNKRKFY